MRVVAMPEPRTSLPTPRRWSEADAVLDSLAELTPKRVELLKRRTSD